MYALIQARLEDALQLLSTAEAARQQGEAQAGNMQKEAQQRQQQLDALQDEVNAQQRRGDSLAEAVTALQGYVPTLCHSSCHWDFWQLLCATSPNQARC